MDDSNFKMVEISYSSVGSSNSKIVEQRSVTFLLFGLREFEISSSKSLSVLSGSLDLSVNGSPLMMELEALDLLFLTPNIYKYQ